MGGEEGSVHPSKAIVLPALRISLQMLVHRDRDCRAATAPKDSFQVGLEPQTGVSLMRKGFEPMCTVQKR